MKNFSKKETKELFKNAVNSSSRIKIIKENKELEEFFRFQIDNLNGIFKNFSEYIRFIQTDMVLKKCPVCRKDNDI